MPIKYSTESPQQNSANIYIESAKSRFTHATKFWQRKRTESYSKLLFTTYHPVKLASKFFKSIGRIAKGIFLLIGAVFNKPIASIPKVLVGIGLEISALFINVFNIIIFLIPDILGGIIFGILFNLIN